MRQRLAGVWESDDGRLATANLTPGRRVYDEDLFTRDGTELRSWNPQRSKLAAYVLKGGRLWPFDERSRVLYLGAANGTTPSHVSDVVRHGLVHCVEFSARSFRDLLGVCEIRHNMVPVMADAGRVEAFGAMVGDVDVLYMDVSQRNQADIFARNLAHFRPKVGFLMVKARSIDVARDPREIFDETAASVERLAPYRVVERVDLAPFERDHVALVVEPGQGSARPPAPQPQFERREPRRDDRRGPPRGGGREWRGPPRDARGPPRERDRDRGRPHGRGPPPRRDFPPKKG